MLYIYTHIFKSTCWIKVTDPQFIHACHASGQGLLRVIICLFIVSIFNQSHISTLHLSIYKPDDILNWNLWFLRLILHSEPKTGTKNSTHFFPYNDTSLHSSKCHERKLIKVV
jgi:hypothetical protein